MRVQTKVFVLLSVIIFLSAACYGATITGTVNGVDGAPFQGAFVEAQNAKTKITVIVLSDSQGRYRIPDLSAGGYRVQIKAVGYRADSHTGVNPTADQNASFDFALLSAEQLWPPGKGKELILENYSTCNEFGRVWPRSRVMGWLA